MYGEPTVMGLQQALDELDSTIANWHNLDTPEVAVQRAEVALLRAMAGQLVVMRGQLDTLLDTVLERKA